MTNDKIEQEIQRKGLNAPRITLNDIESNIDAEVYFTAQHGIDGAMAKMELHSHHPGDGAQLGHLGLLTFCVIVLRNGFTITGESACVSPENFDADIGRKIARQNAVAKIWPLMGYNLRQQLHENSKNF